MRCGQVHGAPLPALLHVVRFADPPDPTPFCLLQAHDCWPNEDVERALRASERRAQDIVDNVEALVYIKALDGRLTLMNRHFQQRYGACREDLGRKTTADYFPRRLPRSTVSTTARS